jgi:hypothetical protein
MISSAGGLAVAAVSAVATAVVLLEPRNDGCGGILRARRARAPVALPRTWDGVVVGCVARMARVG